MRTLIIKTSSLGDVLHTLPAVTDAARHKPAMRFDWVVEEAFAEVPEWHVAIDDVIPVAIRRWKHQLLHALRTGEPQALVRRLRSHQYEHVIDAQGLIKSAVMARCARGLRSGLDRDSAREPLAARAYDHGFAIARNQHAVQRVRQLFAAALDYPMPRRLPITASRRISRTVRASLTWYSCMAPHGRRNTGRMTTGSGSPPWRRLLAGR